MSQNFQSPKIVGFHGMFIPPWHFIGFEWYPFPHPKHLSRFNPPKPPWHVPTAARCSSRFRSPIRPPPGDPCWASAAPLRARPPGLDWPRGGWPAAPGDGTTRSPMKSGELTWFELPRIVDWTDWTMKNEDQNASNNWEPEMRIDLYNYEKKNTMKKPVDWTINNLDLTIKKL